MGWLWAIIVGFVLGLIAKAVIPGKQHIPLWLSTICGIVGALVGNAIARGFGVAATPGIDWSRHIFQVVAAVVIVFFVDMLYNAMQRRRHQGQRA
ncbi:MULTISPECIES: GlsB/YeaQ/YmgE family stress response membrane protein [Streptomyces]|uniref:GlsB/YeaQ/YmgE family stress response membrane protein n=2 Tax=Streptomyces viridosporus TaxID=67581 RepID=A0ABX6AB79_STRVD|nr:MULTISPECIES: GlsB/YeaQ/YmgE family stress response membrane protein [Streptomyces]EFE70320.1 transglycosylase associated protein [Streptomyces viridosporus ATCC 14672]PWJ04472.1 GlsB/YeaQ/YmgE family stress response membrane protein [Streptomyces sp. NWU49]QEU85019.1 GlsB/YeaQ/YmgE family stress response membrane protein [Streptomyces viridosporus T7A]